MEPILTIGIILLTGFVAGGLCRQIGLPKVTGYILAGLVLNPELTHFIPSSFVDHTNLVTQIALAFITFSVGGTLQRSKIRSMGKTILYITLFEAEFAFLSVAVFFILLAPVVLVGPDRGLLTYFIPMGLMLASLAAPTDPSATLAVAHEFHAKGDVTATIMGVAAFDDILGIINYSLAVSVAGIFASQLHFSPYSIAWPFLKIAGSIAGGCVFAGGLNVLSKWIGNETEGVLISLIISLLALCYGIIDKVGADALLATMTMGIIVVNHNPQSEKIFSILERYTEELIFILFFTISTMHLNFSVLASNYLLIFMFVFFRLIGKIGGTAMGGKLANASDRVQKYTAGGLIPQGGIVIGLALVIKQNPAFNTVSDVILNVIIGATIIHEIVGPMLSKWALSKAGEIKAGSR
ncbi:cation:proton antiporter [Desulfosarcina ovata]|uniref:Potassium transporter n=1 Tax=Desulfosarcina ovata subsp. ovata TaxID=2752305 RepID=A0A5K8A7P2_9BACT|nr:cation:proton antiporter [Desulfosarcina ovata]BBO88663.1 potassium transporter [Desulfosarcina ovata subsp. ovata]